MSEIGTETLALNHSFNSKNSSSIWSRIAPQLSPNDDLYGEQLSETAIMADRAFAIIFLIEWLVGIVLSLIVSPFAWAGAQASIHVHVWAAVLLGIAITWPAALLAWLRPGRIATRHFVAAAQMLIAALFIHLTGGRIETHFMIFGSLAFLAAYRDWRILITATLVVLIDHLLRGWYYPRSVYGVDAVAAWRSIEHASWVVFEDIFLIFMIWRTNQIQQDVANKKMSEFGQYTLKEKLGEGGMGSVYLAEHRLLKRLCAIKLVRPSISNDEATLNRFEREVQTTAKLRHPNTVDIFDYGSLEDGTFYYVMELLPGLSLQKLVSQYGPMSAGRVVFLLRQVCGALHEAHAMGMVHRDIKPENVLVCQLGGLHDVAKLFDFGLVRPFIDSEMDSRLTQIGAILGTPHYMAPEQVTGGQVDQRTDLYSLGAVAYFLLTGRRPFSGENPLQVMCARITEPLQPPSVHVHGIPEDLERVILKCMQVDPNNRYTDARSLEHDLAALPCVTAWDEEVADEWWSQQNSLNSDNEFVLSDTTAIHMLDTSPGT